MSGRTVTGDLQEGDGVRWLGGQYYDEWTYSAAMGQRVAITMASEAVYPYLMVLRDDGTELATDDGGGASDSARVEFRALATDQYTIIATSFPLREDRSVHDPGATARGRWGSKQCWRPHGTGRGD